MEQHGAASHRSTGGQCPCEPYYAGRTGHHRRFFSLGSQYLSAGFNDLAECVAFHGFGGDACRLGFLGRQDDFVRMFFGGCLPGRFLPFRVHVPLRGHGYGRRSAYLRLKHPSRNIFSS